MKKIYSVEVDRYNPLALASCLEDLSNVIPGFEYDWIVYANGGGIDYGVFLNVDIEKKTITIANQPEFGTDGDDYLEDVIKCFEEEE